MFYFPWQGDYNDMLLGKLINPLQCLMQAVTVLVQTWAGQGVIPQVRDLKIKSAAAFGSGGAPSCSGFGVSASVTVG